MSTLQRFNCFMLLCFGLQSFIITYTTLILPLIWVLPSETSVLFGFISKQLQDTETHAGFFSKWVGCGGDEVQLQVKEADEEDGEEMTVGNYTCETRHGAHNFNANSSTTGKH